MTLTQYVAHNVVYVLEREENIAGKKEEMPITSIPTCPAMFSNV